MAICSDLGPRRAPDNAEDTAVLWNPNRLHSAESEVPSAISLALTSFKSCEHGVSIYCAKVAAYHNVTYKAHNVSLSIGIAHMPDDVDILIEKLKAQFRVKSDQDLSKALGLSRSAVATWRTRGKAPDRYQKLRESSGVERFYGCTPWHAWSELEKAGLELALLRLTAKYGQMLSDFGEYLKHGRDLPIALGELHSIATDDIANAMCETSETEVRACLQQIVYREFFASTKS